mmetsp:Transcript_15026/g.36981  ORF Transcript_15026/g.36981 Transcript_15026/m.36981 type:complete len:107 (+) Transcript_15026:1857-2177(+)
MMLSIFVDRLGFEWKNFNISCHIFYASNSVSYLEIERYDVLLHPGCQELFVSPTCLSREYLEPKLVTSSSQIPFRVHSEDYHVLQDQLIPQVQRSDTNDLHHQCTV